MVVLLLLWSCATYNGFVKTVSCDEAFSTMDVYLKKRNLSHSNLVVKGYAAHESGDTQWQQLDLPLKFSEKLEKGISIWIFESLFANCKSRIRSKGECEHPQLMDQLSGWIVSLILVRKYYNTCCKKFNVNTSISSQGCSGWSEANVWSFVRSWTWKCEGRFWNKQVVIDRRQYC